MTAGLAEAERHRLRRRALWVLVAGVALGSTGHIAAVTVATIVAQEIAGTSALSGAPGATVILGSALGATLLAAIMARRGRRIGIAAGYGLGVIGALAGTASIVAGSLPLLLAGTFLIGFGNSANQLSRYAAADMYPENRRASAIGTVVWAATVGAVVGPNLIAPAGTLAEWLGLPRLAGAYLFPTAFVGVAGLLSWALLNPDPFALAEPSPLHDNPARGESSVRDLLRRPAIALPLLGLVAGQVVMVLIMTMTPLHMDHHGHGLEAIGLVISAHTFGMFALAPLSGRLSDRFGGGPVVLAGLAVIALSAVMSALAPPAGGAILAVALFLLGFGWSLGYVAGSSLLTRDLRLADRTRLQGMTDSVIWSSAAAASLSSGIVLAVAGYTALGLIGAGLVVVPLWLLFSRRARLEPSRSRA